MSRSTIDISYIQVSGNNTGNGYGVFKGLSGNTLNFKTLVAGANISLSTDTNTIVISGSSGGGGGTITGGTNVGVGNGIYSGITASNLKFKSLVAGSGISLTPAANTITINSTATNTALNVGSGNGLCRDKTGTTLTFKT